MTTANHGGTEVTEGCLVVLREFRASVVKLCTKDTLT
jgi:hypothetical protein